jgi:predicted enzyme related to lactoylglutathione lyase
MSQTSPLGPIGQIHVTVEDLPRAVAFYRDVLGLPFLFEVPGQSMAFFDCHGIRLYLGKVEAGVQPSHPLLYFRVGDIAAEHVELARRGVVFEGPPHVIHRTGTTELWMAFFHDSEGTLLALMSERPSLP